MTKIKVGGIAGMKRHTTIKYVFFSLIFYLFLTAPNITLIRNNEFTYISHAEDIVDDHFSTTQLQPVTPLATSPWNHQVMNIDHAWADGYTGADIRIAILDTGFNIQHPDLNMAGGNSVFPDDPWSNDHSGHGTHVAGIIGAATNTPYQGIAPGAQLYGIKIYHEENIDEFGYVSTNVESVINGIRLAMDFDVDIIVISSGLTFDDNELHEQIIEAHQQDILIIAASGNGSSAVNFPASYPEVIAVTAVDERLHPALDIIYGQENEFAAPGVNIGGLSIPGSPYSYPYILMSGSSQAVPHVAGLAAILMEKHDERGEVIRQIMQETAMNLGDSGFYGYGLIQYISEEEEQESNPSPKPVQDTPPTPNGDNEVTPADNTNEESDEEATAKKPSSARAPDEEEEEELETTAHYFTDAIEQGDNGALARDILQLIENGGRLEIQLNDFNSLYLSERQVNVIRERNIRLVLARDNASWSIPPANLLPGNALLRFYEGAPVGRVPHEGAVSPIFTTSIYQHDTNRSIYPSQMRIRIQMEHFNANELRKLGGFAWDNENKEWFEPISEAEEDQMVITTRHTTTLGILDPDLIPEEVEKPAEVIPDIEDEENLDQSILNQVIIGAVLFIALLIIIRLVVRKRK